MPSHVAGVSFHCIITSQRSHPYGTTPLIGGIDGVCLGEIKKQLLMHYFFIFTFGILIPVPHVLFLQPHALS
jgi:hypothetical protein